MASFIRKLRKNIGAIPGEVVHIGKQDKEPVNLEAILYNDQDLQEPEVVFDSNIPILNQFDHSTCQLWLNVTGIHDLSIIKKLGLELKLHPLIQEDIANALLRPKIDELDGKSFISCKMIHFDDESHSLITEQISLILCPNMLISFQEYPGDLFDPIRQRLRSHKGKIRQYKTDYLLFTLLDTILDHYFLTIEKISEIIDDMEDSLLENPHTKNIKEIHRLKRDVILIRKATWPMREIISQLEKNENKLIKKESRIYYKSIYEHTIQVMDALESSKDLLSSLLDVYLTTASNRMNQVMKVLTIISTIFIPLTFIAGIYGMNFHVMPELSVPWAYFAVLGVMLIISIGMIVFFKRKKWF